MPNAYENIRVKKIALRAEGYLELDMPSYALLELRKASQLHVSCNPGLFYLEGAALHQLRKYREALYPLGQAVLLEPSNIKIWLLIGNCQKRIGRCDLAIESLENALALQPNSAVALYNLACYQALAKHPRECLNYLTKAIRLDEKYREFARHERGFQLLNDNPAFQELMQSSPETNSAANSETEIPIPEA